MNVFDVLREKFEKRKENCIYNQKMLEEKDCMHLAADCKNKAQSYASAIEIVNQVEQEYKPKTNADCIRAMSDEELTKIIMCPYDTAGASIDIMPCVTELGTQKFVSPEFCNQCMMKWLQREVDT